MGVSVLKPADPAVVYVLGSTWQSYYIIEHTGTGGWFIVFGIHAAVWFCNISITDDSITSIAVHPSANHGVLLGYSRLFHRPIRSESANQLFDEDDLSKQKNQRMATLLGFSTDPSREALMEELIRKGVMAQVSHEPSLNRHKKPCLTFT